MAGVGDTGEPGEELEVGEHEGPFAFVVRCSSFVVRLNLSSDDDRGIPFLRKEYAGMGTRRSHGARSR